MSRDPLGVASQQAVVDVFGHVGVDADFGAIIVVVDEFELQVCMFEPLAGRLENRSFQPRIRGAREGYPEVLKR